MEYNKSISLECPYCNTKCQFTEHLLENNTHHCSADRLSHIAYICTNCNGLITTLWFKKKHLITYHPKAGGWKPKVDLAVITNKSVRDDFQEAINCFNNGFHNACMIMARRAIQQEMIIKKAKGNDLYKQIESMEISGKLKKLLNKVKNFGNSGAHPDVCLFDSDGKQIEDKKKFAELSLEFLSRYFADEYEIPRMIDDAPKNKQELKEK